MSGTMTICVDVGDQKASIIQIGDNVPEAAYQRIVRAANNKKSSAKMMDFVVGDRRVAVRLDRIILVDFRPQVEAAGTDQDSVVEGGGPA